MCCRQHVHLHRHRNPHNRHDRYDNHHHRCRRHVQQLHNTHHTIIVVIIRKRKYGYVSKEHLGTRRLEEIQELLFSLLLVCSFH